MSQNIKITEMFGPTCQGEGPNVGSRCIFVRVCGCSFKCSWCDSKYTWSSSNHDYTEYTAEELADAISIACRRYKCNRIVLTGGNPCLYDFGPVIRQCRPDIAFDIETQGDITPEWLSCIDTVVFSPKPPSSGMEDTYDNIVNYIKKTAPEGQQIAIKIPVFNDEDIEFARKYAKFLGTWTNVHDNELKLYLSVGNSDVDTAESIRDRVLTDYESLLNKINEHPEDFQNVFILPQIHTLVWGNKQGV